MLEQVEESIEGSTAMPSFEPEPLVLPPEVFEPMLQGPTSQGSPPPPEGSEGRWGGGLVPSLHVKPYYTLAGLAQPPLLSRGHGSTGIRNTSALGSVRLCPDSGKLVDEEVCRACDKWDDHGAGYEQCRYEWEEEHNSQEPAGDTEE